MSARVREMARLRHSVGGAGDRGFSRHVGERAADDGCHAQQSLVRTAASLPRGVRHGPPIARLRVAPPHAQAHSLGFDGGRGGSALPADRALLTRLLYRTSIRPMESLRLRVKDVDFDRGVVVVR